MIYQCLFCTNHTISKYNIKKQFSEDQHESPLEEADSFLKGVEIDDLFTVLKNRQKNSCVDFSILEKSPKLYDETNKKLWGKFKIETLNAIKLDDFLALRPIANAYTYDNVEEPKNSSELQKQL